MRLGEAARQLQPVAERPVDRDVNGPDRRNVDAQALLGDQPDDQEQGRPDQHVNGVVAYGPDARAGGIADHGEGGYEDQEQEQCPGRAAPGIGHQPCRRDAQPFEPEQTADDAGDGSPAGHAPRFGRSRMTTSTLAISIPAGGSGRLTTSTGPESMSKMRFSP